MDAFRTSLASSLCAEPGIKPLHFRRMVLTDKFLTTASSHSSLPIHEYLFQILPDNPKITVLLYTQMRPPSAPYNIFYATMTLTSHQGNGSKNSPLPEFTILVLMKFCTASKIHLPALLTVLSKATEWHSPTLSVTKSIPIVIIIWHWSSLCNSRLYLTA